MRRKWELSEERYFGIGVYQPKTRENIGTLWRSALIMGASFIFVIEEKYKKQSSDVLKTWSKIPLFQHEHFDHFYSSLPYSCKLIGVELDKKAIPIQEYEHPPRAIYLLGSEQIGLPKAIKNKCHELVQLPGEMSLNVAVAGSIMIYDRVNKMS